MISALFVRSTAVTRPPGDSDYRWSGETVNRNYEQFKRAVIYRGGRLFVDTRLADRQKIGLPWIRL